MAKVTTLPEYLWPLMDGYSIDTPYCAVCGRTYPLNRHHVVRRGAGKLFRDGKEVPKPTIMLCGSGNASGCHGKAHQNRLHFRWTGRWEYLETEEPTEYIRALDMDGWRPLHA